MGWIEISSVPEVRVDIVPNQGELAWFTRYPLSSKIIVDSGGEILAEFKTMMENAYRILCNSISVGNPQPNAMMERVHQNNGSIINIFNIQQMDLNNENPWEGILSFTMVAILCTLYTTTQHILSQLVFGMNTILSINQKAHSQFITQGKQVLINKGNWKENPNR